VAKTPKDDAHAGKAEILREQQTIRNKRTFLEAYAQTGNVSAAAKLAGVGRRTHYDWLENDEAYAAAFAEAADDAADLLEAEARRRAVEGLVRYKFNKDGTPIIHPDAYKLGPDGTLVLDPTVERVRYFEREYSDTLLIFLLKGARPEKYAERRVLSGKGKGGAILLEDIVAGAAASSDEAKS
jgi:hypothetical protein